MVFHLHRLQQHQVTLQNTCNYDCLGCLHRDAVDQAVLPASAKAGDILNIYGGGVQLSPQLPGIIAQAKVKGVKPRVFGNHALLQCDPTLLTDIAELVVWCPTPDPTQFNFLVGGQEYAEFKAAIMAPRTPKLTLAMGVRPLTLELLPEFYDLCVAANASGHVLYWPKEFTKEERRYIQRFKRVKGMRVIKQRLATGPHCLAAPNRLGTFSFELGEWGWAMRQSLKRLPLVGPML